MELQNSEKFRVGALLAVTGGIMDAYTYMCRGHVFANAQTGNIVLMGIRAARGHWIGLLSALLPVLAFAVGILVTELMKKYFKTEEVHRLHWRHIMLGLEIILIGSVTFVPIGRMDNLVNLVVSFVCAMQAHTFRKVHGYAYASTMCTGNLRSGTEALSNYIRTGKKDLLNKCLCCYGIIIFFIGGALLGACGSTYTPQYTLLYVVAIHLIVFIIMIEGKHCRD